MFKVLVEGCGQFWKQHMFSLFNKFLVHQSLSSIFTKTDLPNLDINFSVVWNKNISQSTMGRFPKIKEIHQFTTVKCGKSLKFMAFYRITTFQDMNASKSQEKNGFTTEQKTTH